MNVTLLLSALLMGLAGTVHCFAMCGVPGAAVVQTCGGQRPVSAVIGFHLGRVAGYAAAGALVAASVSMLAALGRFAAVLKPLWVMAHMAAFALGLWLLVKGQQPAWLERMGRHGARRLPGSIGMGNGSPWQPVIWGGGKAALAGAAWFAWPCGLLQSALMVAALADTPISGAAVMVVFSIASASGLIVGPAWLRWLGNQRDKAEKLTRWTVRFSGAALAAASIWALGHDVISQVIAYCLT